MKTRLFYFLKTILIFFSINVSAQAAELVDRIVAVVGDDIITWQELQEKVKPYEQTLPASLSPLEKQQKSLDLQRQTLEVEIGERLLAKELNQHKDGLSVTEKDIDKAVTDIMKMNRLNDIQFQTALYGQGLSMQSYREKLRQQLEKTRLLQSRVQGRVQVKDHDVQRRCLERKRLLKDDVEVCVQHIFWMKRPYASEEQKVRQKNLIEDVQHQLKAGASFEAMAQKSSEDTSQADGDLGCFRRGEMLATIEEAAFDLTAGSISSVIETEQGFHILKLKQRRHQQAAVCQEDEDLEPIRQELLQEEMQRQIQLWMDELREKSFVDIRL